MASGKVALAPLVLGLRVPRLACAACACAGTSCTTSDGAKAPRLGGSIKVHIDIFSSALQSCSGTQTFSMHSGLFWSDATQLYATYFWHALERLRLRLRLSLTELCSSNRTVQVGRRSWKLTSRSRSPPAERPRTQQSLRRGQERLQDRYRRFRGVRSPLRRVTGATGVHARVQRRSDHMCAPAQHLFACRTAANRTLWRRKADAVARSAQSAG